MASKRKKNAPNAANDAAILATDPDALLQAALASGGDGTQTGRYIVSYREGAVDDGLKSLKTQGLRVCDARDFATQAASLQDAGDADAMVLPEIGVAVVTGAAGKSQGMGVTTELEADSPIEAIEPDYFMFASGDANEYLRGFASAVNAIAREFGPGVAPGLEEEDVEAEVLGATWGLVRCRVSPSLRNGLGIKVAVLDTGMDLGHPDFANRVITSKTFVGQPVSDLHGHGTHCTGTALGPKAPPGSTPRYGIAWGSRIFTGKVLTNTGSGTMAGVLAGMNWAIASRCEVISMSLGAQIPVQVAYTNSGAAALRNGCLIVAAAGNAASSTGAPANSPTIMSVAALDKTLVPSNFSNFGKVEIAAPGRDVFSSWKRPARYNTISGTSMATPHVAGCAALWAQTNATLRGMNLWRRLQATARRLPFPASKVGAGLVQAPA